MKDQIVRAVVDLWGGGDVLVGVKAIYSVVSFLFSLNADRARWIVYRVFDTGRDFVDRRNCNVDADTNPSLNFSQLIMRLDGEML